MEVQRIIGLSLNKIQMGRNQRGGLPLHKNLLVATVLNKARDAYMHETMYMNYRLMACGQFAAQQELEEEEEEEASPEAEDYEEDSESDVEDDNNVSVATSGAVVDHNSTKEYGNAVLSMVAGTLATAKPSSGHLEEATAVVASANSLPAVPVKPNNNSTDHSSSAMTNNNNNNNNNDEGFIEDDSTDCDCDARNFCQETSRVPFQYCFNCAPFHPSNGRGPTLVSPLLQQHHHHQSTTAAATTAAATMTSAGSSSCQEVEDHNKVIIYDMDSGLATRNSGNSSSSQQRLAANSKRKRHISVEETEEAVNSILLGKRRRRCESPVSGESSSATADEEETDADCLNDSGFQEESEVRMNLKYLMLSCQLCVIFTVPVPV